MHHTDVSMLVQGVHLLCHRLGSDGGLSCCSRLPPCRRQALFAAMLCTWNSEAAAGAWAACAAQFVLPCGSLGKPLELLRRLQDLSP